MADRKRLVLIGAGSAMFTQGLIADTLQAGKNWDISLVDLDPRALKVAEGLAKKMVQAKGADINVDSSTDRCDVLPGADVIVTTIGVGGRRAWEADFVIPRKYGVWQPVADTAMAGGISRALRMIPAMVDIACDVERLAPDALFFNYANPMTCNCMAVRKATKANMVGLCIGTIHVIHELADVINAPHDEVTAMAAGINHFTWVYDLRWKGQDAWPLIRKHLAEERAKGGLTVSGDMAPGGDTTMATRGWRHVAHNPFSWSLFDAYGAYPAVNDRHVIEFFPERFPNGDYFGKKLGKEIMVLEDTIAYGDKVYSDMAAQAESKEPPSQAVFDRSLGEHSQLIEIIDGIAADNRKVVYANLPNRGAIPNLPYDAVLEMTSVATGRGIMPVQDSTYPDTLAAVQTRKITGEMITVEAALTGSRQLFVEALLLDGSVSDRTVAEKLADELLAAHKQYLPQFA